MNACTLTQRQEPKGTVHDSSKKITILNHHAALLIVEVAGIVEIA